jgi:hypothetical protein
MTSIPKRVRELHRLIEPLAGAYGARFRIDQTASNHLRVTFIQGTRQFPVFLPLTPGSRFAPRQAHSLIKRKLKGGPLWT